MAVTKKKAKGKPATKKRLKRRRDWHAWAWRADDGRLSLWGYYIKPKWKPYGKGKWVRVKFVEVPAKKRGG